MSGLVARLRWHANLPTNRTILPQVLCDDLREAADEIERLTAERDRAVMNNEEGNEHYNIRLAAAEKVVEAVRRASDLGHLIVRDTEDQIKAALHDYDAAEHSGGSK